MHKAVQLLRSRACLERVRCLPSPFQTAPLSRYLTRFHGPSAASMLEASQPQANSTVVKMSGDDSVTDAPNDDSNELDWLLRVNVRTAIEQLTQILTDCANSIISNTPAQYNLSFYSQNQMDTLRTIKTCIKETTNNPFCWRLHQIQDAINHLNHAIDLLKDTPLRQESNNNESAPSDQDFEPADEVIQLVDSVMNRLQKSRSSLLIPKKSSVEELQNSQNMQSISPALPLDYTISFYIQASNLVCSVYHLSQSNNRAQVKNEYQAEVPIPFLSDVLILLSLGLQVCQQLKDKVQTLQDAS